MIGRRGFLAGIIAAGVAPAIIHNPMKIWVPRTDLRDLEIVETFYPSVVINSGVMELGVQPMFRHLNHLRIMHIPRSLQ